MQFHYFMKIYRQRSMICSVTMFCFLPVSYSIQRCIGRAQNGKCRECLPGYIGENCSHTCRYPSYGDGCQHICDCDVSSCNIARGCSQATECQPGYFGFNCIHQCRYPNYGINCQLFCVCEKQFCDITTGCKTISTPYKVQTSIIKGYKTTDQQATTANNTPYQTIPFLKHTQERSRTLNEDLDVVFATGISRYDPKKEIRVSEIVKSGIQSTQSANLLQNKGPPEYTDVMPLIPLLKSPTILSILIGTSVLLIFVAVIIVKLCKRRVGSGNQLVKELVPVYYAPVETLRHDQKTEQLSFPMDDTVDRQLSQSSEERLYETIDTEAVESMVYEQQSEVSHSASPQQSVVTMDHCPQPMENPEKDVDSEGYQRPCSSGKGSSTVY